MSPEAAIALLRSTPFAAGRVRRVPVPGASRRLVTLSHIDYEDAFAVETDGAQDRTAEQWLRAILEGAPLVVRQALRSAWSALGLRSGPTGSEGHVLGWEVRRSTADHVLVGAGSRVGLAAELLLRRRRQTLLFSTFVQKDNALGRAVWAGIEPMHGPTVRYVLAQASAS